MMKSRTERWAELRLAALIGAGNGLFAWVMAWTADTPANFLTVVGGCMLLFPALLVLSYLPGWLRRRREVKASADVIPLNRAKRSKRC